MRNNYRLDYLSDEIESQRGLLETLISSDNILDFLKSNSEITRLIDSNFPSISLEDKKNLVYLLIKSNKLNNMDKTHMVWSGPEVAGIRGRNTQVLFEELIQEARYSILISIYSLSEYANKLIQLLKKKADQGVYVEVFVDDYEGKTKLLSPLMNARNNKLSIYDYVGATNHTQVLHAKVITVDGEKSVVTSANLSFNGMDGNLELGVLLQSKERAKEIRSIFNTMLEKGYFVKKRNK
jgi:phosphatidylserine/phosphatidylglycerophosphate/cardiolipin synthase-like enzyme